MFVCHWCLPGILNQHPTWWVLRWSSPFRCGKLLHSGQPRSGGTESRSQDIPRGVHHLGQWVWKIFTMDLARMDFLTVVGYHWVYRNDGFSADFANETNSGKWMEMGKFIEMLWHDDKPWRFNLSPKHIQKKQNKSSTLLSQQGFSWTFYRLVAAIRQAFWHGFINHHMQ